MAAYYADGLLLEIPIENWNMESQYIIIPYIHNDQLFSTGIHLDYEDLYFGIRALELVVQLMR